MLRKYLLLVLLGFFLAVTINSCKKPKPVAPQPTEVEEKDTFNRNESFLLTMVSTVDGERVEMFTSLDSGKLYTTSLGEDFRVKVFSYYFSNAYLIAESGTRVPLLPKYNLIEAIKGDFQQQFNIPNDKYVAIEFLLGVDSARNVSGIQSGALDPILGMFWEWNTGYIMAKLEGVTDVIPAGYFAYHTGGFREPYNSLRTIKIDLEQPLTPNGEQRNLVIYADILKWFDGVYPISIVEHSAISIVGEDAMKIADNYTHMFIKNEIR